MSVFIIGCLHIGHENMAKTRGFGCSYQHDSLIFENWNNTVSKRDKVFILGDITMEKSNYDFFERLNGYKHVVLGNHDQPQHVPFLLKYVDKVSGPFRYKNEYWLTHIPVHPIEFEYRVKMNIHAHIHEVELNDARYFNVDAKRIGYKPISFDDILKQNT